MFRSAGSVERLANRLARLPGIGRKSAARLAFHILKLPKQEAHELADLIREVKEKVGFCSICFNISESDPCQVCSDHKREQDVICVVEETSDAAAIDKAESYYLKYIRIREEMDDKPGLAIYYNKMGIIAKEREELETALDLYNRSLDMKKVMNDRKGIAVY